MYLRLQWCDYGMVAIRSGGIGMTENKAINEIVEEVCSGCYGSDEEPHRCSTCGFKMAKDALKEIRQYHAIEKRLADMFGGELPLAKYVDDLELALKEPDSPHPMNARILTYEESAMWEAYKAIGTTEELQALKEKAEAKKPIIVHKQTCQLGTEVEWKCPVCGRNCIELAPCQKYCADCGTKFDWS